MNKKHLQAPAFAEQTRPTATPEPMSQRQMRPRSPFPQGMTAKRTIESKEPSSSPLTPVTPAKAGVYSTASASGKVDSRLRGNDMISEST